MTKTYVFYEVLERDPLCRARQVPFVPSSFKAWLITKQTIYVVAARAEFFCALFYSILSSIMLALPAWLETIVIIFDFVLQRRRKDLSRRHFRKLRAIFLTSFFKEFYSICIGKFLYCSVRILLPGTWKRMFLVNKWQSVIGRWQKLVSRFQQSEQVSSVGQWQQMYCTTIWGVICCTLRFFSQCSETVFVL